MTNDLNGHEQWRTYGVHLHVTHWGYDYMSLIEGQGVRLPILLEFSEKFWCILSKILLLQKTLITWQISKFSIQ